VLILVDGNEINPDMININDIKSVEIIKGSNMYGFRGANGVVLITTLSAKDLVGK
jgi:TonB-dependent SusC/RagA subfamily outer membrane receptor